MKNKTREFSVHFQAVIALNLELKAGSRQEKTLERNECMEGESGCTSRDCPRAVPGPAAVGGWPGVGVLRNRVLARQTARPGRAPSMGA